MGYFLPHANIKLWINDANCNVSEMQLNTADYDVVNQENHKRVSKLRHISSEPHFSYL